MKMLKPVKLTKRQMEGDKYYNLKMVRMYILVISAGVSFMGIWYGGLYGLVNLIVCVISIKLIMKYNK